MHKIGKGTYPINWTKNNCYVVTKGLLNKIKNHIFTIVRNINKSLCYKKDGFTLSSSTSEFSIVDS